MIKNIISNFKFKCLSTRVGKSSNITERKIEKFEKFPLYRSKRKQKFDPAIE